MIAVTGSFTFLLGWKLYAMLYVPWWNGISLYSSYAVKKETIVWPCLVVVVA